MRSLVVAMPSLVVAAVVTSLPSAPKTQPFSHVQHVQLADVDYLEARGTAGDDSPATAAARQLYLLPSLLSSDEAAEVLKASNLPTTEFDTVHDTVDDQATYLCRVIEGGETVDAHVARALAPFLDDRLLPYVRAKFGCASACVADVLVRRYLPNERRRLEAHFDVSSFATAIVPLSPACDYEGGLYVQHVPGVASRRYVELEAGDCLVHRFDTMHGVHVASGERFSLVVWLSDGPSSLLDGSAPWVQQAAEEGNAEAQFVLGGFHYRGDEFGYGRADLGLATRWLAASARQGNALAQVHLASMISAGEISGEMLGAALREALPADGREGGGLAAAEGSGAHAAAELYRRAAAQGHPSAQYALGRCYLGGEGVARDEDRAREWLACAASQGADENVAAAWAADELARLDAGAPPTTSA